MRENEEEMLVVKMIKRGSSLTKLRNAVTQPICCGKQRVYFAFEAKILCFLAFKVDVLLLKWGSGCDFNLKRWYLISQLENEIIFVRHFQLTRRI